MQEYSGNINLSEFEIDADRKYFDKVIFKNVSYSSLKKINITFTKSMFDNVVFNKCNLSGIAIYENTIFNNCHFYGCKITSSLFRGSVFENCIFEKCNIKGLIVLENAIIKNSLFKSCKFNDVSFRTSNFINNKIAGKIYNSRFWTDPENPEPLVIDLSEAIIDYTDFLFCDLSQAKLPKNENMKFIHDINKIARKSMSIIENIKDTEKKRVMKIYVERYTEEQYQDFIFNIEQQKKHWEEYYDDIAPLLGLS